MFGIVAGVFAVSGLLLLSTAAAGTKVSEPSARRKRLLWYGFLAGSVGTAGSLIVTGLLLHGLIGVILAAPFGVIVIVSFLRLGPFVALGTKMARLSPSSEE